VIDFGDVPASTTLYIPFASYGKTNGESITLTGLAVTDIEIYKNGSTTQRSSDNGYTLLDTDGIDFDGITGIHGFSVDLSDNSDASFYAVGSRYFVVVSSVTVDSQTVNFIAATFRIVAAEAITGKPKVDVDGFGGTAGTFSGGIPDVNAVKISGDSAAADNLEAALDGTGGVTITAAITGNITGNLSGSVGSVTGNVGGNVTGSVGSIATGGITSASFAAGAINNAAMSIDGSELTAIPWNASWDAEVQSEVQDAIEANNLDHLIKNAVDTDFATTVHLNSVIGHLADNGTSATFDRATDSLEALQAAFSAVPESVWDEVQEGGYTARQIHELSAAVLLGISSGFDTGSVIFKGIDGTTTRVAATVDSFGNRSGFTITPRAA